MSDSENVSKGFEHLWAPWRTPYVQNHKQLAEEGCLFCVLGRSQTPREHLRLYCSDLVVVVMNLYPYTSGHLLVAPRSHWASPTHASEEEYRAFSDMVVYVERVLRKVYRPDGLNVGMNLGEAAGAGVPGHFHMHLVPRWAGDTNFMAALSGTRVHPESLESSMDRLTPYFEDGPLPVDHSLFHQAAGAKSKSAFSTVTARGSRGQGDPDK